jgi:hypothetical protein
VGLLWKYRIVFIVMNIGVLVWTPLLAGNLPLSLELKVGILSAVITNLMLFFALAYRERLLGKKKVNETEPRLAILQAKLHTELWISWASLLRSYAAAHGLNSNQFAVIEFGEDEIVVRAGSKWVRFTHGEMEKSDGNKIVFALTEDGRVTLDGKMDEMDFAAERITRELMR